MINRIHALFYRPENGWDPVPAAHAADYGAREWRRVDQGLLDELESRVGGFHGKNILDLGGGPAHYSVAMAQRGGLVTWHDISRNYLEMGRSKAAEAGLSAQIRFSLGYLDEAPRLLRQRFDFVFNRICWNYGFDDASLANVVYTMVRPGGHAYVDTTHSGYQRAALPASVRLRTWLNDCTGVKIGHPMPPHGRLAKLFLRSRMTRMTLDYSWPENDRIFFEKAQDG
jgi:2-polyprenyl-3-methyl-5-hydroxy-6-metoxy-1,4-benzoquinol methylase